MAHVKLKVCGITNLDDALLAIDCGAHYLGFNFYSKSPRYVSPAVVRQILDRTRTSAIAVGVFVNETRDMVETVIAESGVQMAQLHGNEDEAFSEAIGSERVIKVIRPEPGFVASTMARFPAAALLVDTSDAKLYGGTGRTADWKVAAEVASLRPTFLAGGIGPDNVRAAIAEVAPFAVDVNSAVESAPGRKDRAKLEQLRLEMSK